MGNGNGVDWANAYTNLPSNLMRGDTYYIAGGCYGPQQLDAPNDGRIITLMRATSAQHGPTNGWSNNMITNATRFGSVEISTANWLINGATGGGPGSWESGFGFVTTNGIATNGFKDLVISAPVTNITVEHFDMANAGRFTTNNNQDCIYTLSTVTNFTLRYCFLHDVCRCQILTAGDCDKWLIEYCDFARNGPAGDGIHKEAWSGQDENDVTIRYCLFKDISDTAVLALVNGAGMAANWSIYGNVFVDTGLPGVQVSYLLEVKYASPTFITASNWLFYNNDVINYNVGNPNNNVGLRLEDATNCQAYDNLFYNNYGDGVEYYAGIAHDFNWYDDNFTDPVEPNGQVATTNLFANWQSGDYRLTADTADGISLPSPFNVDPSGNTRGVDGYWDRGAYQATGAIVTIQGPPTSLTVVP
ncbi:MAG: hypothetical protein KGR98_06220 [Verrucomicrobia bacterium]|nr:hypothetical protein [Verrucomicrobiota bacterium]MDE3098016.1 hypothetical protein [Verrucomicrobiota bacterium]